MIKIKEAIIVEGRYDINVIKQLVDTVVLETGGFRIFNQKERLQMIRKIAQVRGIVILTDSDGAGFQIRNFLRGAIPKEQVKHAYIPDIYGKEHRKRQAGKEGKLGVEGMTPEILRSALQQAKVTILDQPSQKSSQTVRQITKADFFAWGLTGSAGSAQKRQALLKALQLPQHMTANALLEWINAIAEPQEIDKIIAQIAQST